MWVKTCSRYFSSTCPSQGDWTELVNSDAEALVSVLDNLKNDPDCVSSSGAIAQLGGLASKMTSLESSNQRKIEIEKLKAKEIELSNQIGQSTDTNVIEDLQEAIRDVQVEKASLLAEESSRNKLGGESISETYSQIVTSSNQLYKSISNNQRCLDKNPRIITSVPRYQLKPWPLRPGLNEQLLEMNFPSPSFHFPYDPGLLALCI